MNVLVRDKQVLQALRPLDLTAYLRAHGWKLQDSPHDQPFIAWEKLTDRGTAEVYVPKHQTWRDYAKRIREVVAMLGQVEKRSELQIVNDIPLTTKDIVRVRAVPEGQDEGSISLRDGVRLVQSSRALLLAAACAAHEPRAAYHARKPKSATEYLDTVRLGQTERGSYVINLMSSVPLALSTQPSFADCEPGRAPFARRVTRKLATALTAVRHAAEYGASTGSLDAFQDAVEAGVSADFCEALAVARKCTSIVEIEVGITWAPVRPVEPALHKRHSFTTDALDVIQEAGRVLREKTPQVDFELSGPVIDVSRPRSEMHGMAVIYGSVRGKPKKVRVEVWGRDWEIANQAMAQRRILKCTGELGREGHLFVLRHARDFRKERDE